MDFSIEKLNSGVQYVEVGKRPRTVPEAVLNFYRDFVPVKRILIQEFYRGSKKVYVGLFLDERV
jgi:hypothetical protein